MISCAGCNAGGASTTTTTTNATTAITTTQSTTVNNLSAESQELLKKFSKYAVEGIVFGMKKTEAEKVIGKLDNKVSSDLVADSESFYYKNLFISTDYQTGMDNSENICNIGCQR